MMTIVDVIKEKKTVIADRWLEEIYATYQDEAARFLRSKKDQFANPMGHAIRTGTHGICEQVFGDMDVEILCAHLQEIVKMRAIQDMAPSQALSFVFLLRKAMADVLDTKDKNENEVAAIMEYDHRVDQVALFAFDIFTKCRQQIYDMRINELKRSMASVVKLVNESGSRREMPGFDAG